jgi:hypothetical protein
VTFDFGGELRKLLMHLVDGLKNAHASLPRGTVIDDPM